MLARGSFDRGRCTHPSPLFGAPSTPGEPVQTNMGNVHLPA